MGRSTSSLERWDKLAVSPPTQQASSTIDEPNAPQASSTEANDFDLILQSRDSVSFPVHQAILLAASTNSLGGLLPPSEIFTASLPLIPVDDNSVIVYLIVDALYASAMPGSFIHPGNLDWDSMVTVSSLFTAVERLSAYGLSNAAAVHPSCAVYRQFCKELPNSPMSLFGLAARHELENLAVLASSHLLPPDIIRVSTEKRNYIGEKYYGRLLALHENRLKALQHILERPPDTHEANLLCTDEKQNTMIELWKRSAILVLKERAPR